MLDELTITVSAFARASWARRFRRTLDSLVLLLLLLAVGTGAAYVGFVNHPERTKIRQATLSPAPGFGRGRKGANHFEGATATRFISVPHQPGESDISRGRRQRAFVKALMLRSLSTDVRPKGASTDVVDSPGMAQLSSALRRDDMGGIPQR